MELLYQLSYIGFKNILPALVLRSGGGEEGTSATG